MSSSNATPATGGLLSGKLRSREDVVPAPLRLWDVPTAVETFERANAKDPLGVYVKSTQDGYSNTYTYRVGRRALSTLQLVVAICLRHALCINHGRSVLVDHGDDPLAPPPLFGKLVRRLLGPVIQFIRSFTRSKEQLVRQKEFQGKMKAAVQEILGPRVDSMLEVGGLATHPDWQGRGYASALVRTVTEAGDRTNRACWLGSSNIVNRGFYRSLGFEVVHTFQLGDDDPTWHDKPILFDIMVREPKSQERKDVV